MKISVRQIVEEETAKDAPAYPRLPPEHDARIKLPKSEHAVIRARHEAGEGIRALARAYGVDRRLIQFILFPERIEASRVNRDWKNYYDKEKHRKAIAALRAKQLRVQPDKIIAYAKAAHKRKR